MNSKTKSKRKYNNANYRKYEILVAYSSKLYAAIEEHKRNYPNISTNEMFKSALRRDLNVTEEQPMNNES